jgi:hypothetical protein
MPKAPQAVAVVLAVAVLAGVLSAAPDTQPAKPAADGTYHGVFKFGAVKGGFGRPLTVSVAKVEGGNPFDVLVPDKFARGKIDLEMLKDAEAGDLLEIVCTTAGNPTLISLKKYDCKWGEDEPNVFVFDNKGELKTGPMTNVTVGVTKFLQPFTLLAPNKKGPDGAAVPDETIIKAIIALKTGDLVELVADKTGGQLVIKSARPFEPYRKIELVKVVKGKVGMADLTGVEVKESGGAADRSNTAKFYLDPKGKDFAALSKVIATVPAGAEALIRTTSDDKGNWLIAFRPPAAATSDPTAGGPPAWPTGWHRHRH